MKKIRPICLVFLLFLIVLMIGCGGQRPASGSEAPTASPTAEPTPSPTPEPTPIPFDMVAEQNAPDYVYLTDSQDLIDALETIDRNEKAAASDGEEDETLVPAGVSVDDAGPVGDKMAVEGKWLYILSDKDLLVVEMDGMNTSLVSRVRVGGSWTGRGEEPSEPVYGYERTPSAVYCAGSRLVVTCDWYGYDNVPGDVNYTEYTAVDVYDVTDPSAPILLGGFGQAGSVTAAGVEGNAFYMVTECPVYDDTFDDLPNLPAMYADGGSAELPYSKICFARSGAVNSCALMGVYDLNGPRWVDSQAVLGASAKVYARDGSIFFFVPHTAECASRTLDTGAETARIACTDIIRFTFDEKALELSAAITVNGVIPDSSCLDLFDGTLRCLTRLDQRLYTSGDPEQWDQRWDGSALYLLDASLRPAGKISAGEDAPIRWAGFLGDKAVLTLTDGDSLLVDLKDLPEDLSDLPAVATVEAQAVRSFGEKGYTAFYRTGARKLSLTLYDEKMSALAARAFGSDHSSTLENAHGYIADGDANVVSFSADDSYCIYGYDKSEGLYFRSSVYLDDWAWNARGFRRGEFFYVADTKEIAVLTVSDLEEITRVNF